MCRIDKAVQKADGNGLDAGVPEGSGSAAHGRFVERNFDVSVVAQSVWNFATQPALDDYGRFVRLEIVKIRSPLSADFEQVAEAVAGYQSGR
jgi:hypothetical protein